MSEKVINELLAACSGSEDKPVFVHEITAARQWWHYGDCFPDVETCAVPNRGDIDETAN